MQAFHPCNINGQIIKPRNASIRKGRETGNEAIKTYIIIFVRMYAHKGESDGVLCIAISVITYDDLSDHC